MYDIVVLVLYRVVLHVNGSVLECDVECVVKLIQNKTKK